MPTPVQKFWNIRLQSCKKALEKKPCVKTVYCMDCSSPARICNVWTIHEKSYPKGRIKVILINQDLGL